MTRPVRVLIVDDEPAIREMLTPPLVRQGFECIEAGDAEEAQAQIDRDPPDLVLLDWMLPGLSGIALARRLKANPATQKMPIIMLTARDEEASKVQGLESGADDYVTKPFSPRELLARMKAVLRRVGPRASGQVLEVCGLRLDPDTHRISLDEGTLELGPTEFHLLRFMMENPERVHSRGQLIRLVWGPNAYVEERTVDVHIRRLRKALQPSGHDTLIQTVRSMGYRLSDPARGRGNGF
jgi:two-component system phosphate regulon response regulator PhoB